VMCELETYRGCPRHSHCSFCTEPFYGKPDFREIADVVNEVSALYENGARYFSWAGSLTCSCTDQKKAFPTRVLSKTSIKE